MTEEIKDLLVKQGEAFEAFKSANDSRLKEIEKKGAADPLLVAKVEKINEVLDTVAEQKARLEKLESAAARPGAGVEAKGAESEAEHKKAFLEYMRKGSVAGFDALEQKAMSVQSDPDGGYLVSPTVSAEVVKKVFESSPIRQLASVVTISTDSLDLGNDINEMSSGWVGETTSRSETSTAQIGKNNIPVFELYAAPRASQKLLDDAGINIESWIADKVAEKFGRDEATAFVSGDGVVKPRGILTYTAGSTWGTIEQVVSGSNSAVTADGLINLFYSLKDQYAQNATFLMQRATVGHVRTLKDTTNQYLWQPGLQAGQPDMLLGKPVMFAADMQAYGTTNNLSIALADFKAAYQVVDRIGIRTLRDPYSAKPQVIFYTTKRVGGAVKNFEAIKLMKTST